MVKPCENRKKMVVRCLEKVSEIADAVNAVSGCRVLSTVQVDPLHEEGMGIIRFDVAFEPHREQEQEKKHEV